MSGEGVMNGMKSGLRMCIQSLIPGNRIIWKGSSKRKTVALTFDDGPCAEYTSKFLDILKQEKVRGTFFLVGEQVRKYPELARMVAENGHEIGNHLMTHGHIKKMKFAQMAGEIRGTDEIIKTVIGTTPGYLRPPFAEVSFSMLLYVLFKGHKLAMWNMDSGDSWDLHPTRMRERLRNVHPGDIILFHEDKINSLIALPQIIHDIKALGFEFVSVSDLFKWRK
jgi:peptidoglycan-N-acetylglucosamine deacetylase